MSHHAHHDCSMHEKSCCRAPGAPWISSYLTVKDPGAASEFYQKAFGFDIRESVKDDKGQIVHAEMTYHDALIMFGPESNYHGIDKKSPASLKITPPSGLYVYVENVDEFYKSASAHGAKTIMPPDDMFWGDRMCCLTDPDGYHWNFATYTGKMSTDTSCSGNTSK